MSVDPLVTVVTPTTGNACVLRAIESVANQSYKNVQHLIVIDKPDAPADTKAAIRQCKVDVIELPYATGKDRFLGHRIIGASAFIGKGDFFCYLDEDNWFDTDHIAALLDVIRRGFAWAYSLRKIVDPDGNYICNDDCESLGKWPSIVNPQDYLIDTNCYFLPRMAAVVSSPVWYRRFREPNTMDADRAMVQFLRAQNANYNSSYRYSVNYRVENTAQSVRRDFFLNGNKKMLEQFQGKLPWARGEFANLET